MPATEPDCALVLAQVADSVRAMKRHITNFQMQLLSLSVGKKIEITYSSGFAGKSRENGASPQNDFAADPEDRRGH
jgi:hypothetical protein